MTTSSLVMSSKSAASMHPIPLNPHRPPREDNKLDAFFDMLVNTRRCEGSLQTFRGCRWACSGQEWGPRENTTPRGVYYQVFTCSLQFGSDCGEGCASEEAPEVYLLLKRAFRERSCPKAQGFLSKSMAASFEVALTHPDSLVYRNCQ